MLIRVGPRRTHSFLRGSQMKVSIGFSTSSSVLSALIRWFTNSPISHTFLLVEDLIPGMPMVMQAARGGFQLITYDRFCKGSHNIKIVVPKQDISPGVVQALQWLGEPYDTVGLVGMAIVEVGRRFRRHWRNWIHSSSSMWCSEANTYVLKAANYPGAEALSPSTTSPADLLAFMSS